MKDKNQKRLTVVGVAFVLFLMLYLVKDVVIGMFVSEPPKVFPELRAEEVQEVNIATAGGELVFYREDGGTWRTKRDGEEYPANTELVSELIAGFVELRKDTAISTNKDKHTSLGIEEQKVVLSTAEDATHELFVGDSAGINGNYVRVGDDEEVFVAANFSNVSTAGQNAIDTNLHLIDSIDGVTNVVIQDLGATHTLAKEDDTWMFNGSETKREPVSFFLSDLSVLDGRTLLSIEESQAVFPQQLFIVTVTEGDKDKTLEILSKDESSVYGKVTGEDRLYVLGMNDLENIRTNVADIANPPVEETTPTQAEQ